MAAWQRIGGADDAEIQRRLAYALHRAGRSTEALVAADRMLALQPDNPDSLYLAGLVRTESGLDRARGVALLEQASQRQPGNWLYREALAKAKAAAG